jgi:hypothetical protein
MDITPYVDSLRRDLSAAADAGGPEVRAAAERLTYALDPAMRLALMDVLSEAAAEITSELPAGSVEVRLRGREPELVVDVPTDHTVPLASRAGEAPAPPDAPTAVLPPEPPPAPGEGPDGLAEDDTVTRITLRLPESLKYKAEELATAGGHSLNSWIVNTIRAATRERAVQVDVDLSSIPFIDGPGFPGSRRGTKRMTGWV